MKNILGLILVAVVFIFSACEMDDVAVENTGTVFVTAVTNNNNSTNLKSTIVDRGDVPVYVKGVSVEVSAMASDYSVSEDFLYEVGGEGDMFIEAVALGQNNINAISMPLDTYFPHTFIAGQSNNSEWEIWYGIVSGQENIVRYASFNKWYKEVQGEETFLWWTSTWHQFVQEGEVPVDAMSDFISYIIANERNQETGAPIYAIYEGSTSANVVHENPAEVTVNMTTVYGRQMVTFTVESLDMLDLYNIEIVGDCPTSPQQGNDGIELDGDTPFAISYWSNPESVDGSFTNYTINIREKNSEVILRTETLVVTIAAGVSMWTNVVITDSAFYTDEQALTFTYDELDEENEDVTID